jgi:superfamily I DNA/RNA helicase
MQPSKYQANIIHLILTTMSSILVQACAGAGKTTLLRMICEAIERQWGGSKSIMCVAFNKPIAQEMERKLPRSVVCKTLHSYGYGAIRRAARVCRVDGRKLFNCIDSSLVEMPQHLRETLKSDLLRVVPLVQSTLVDPRDIDAINEIIERVGCEIEDSRCLDLIPIVIGEMDKLQEFITFDEMITRPVRKKLPCTKFDFVLVDETQDLNEAQQELVRMALKPGGRVVAVGDRYQSIYGFRGADPRAMDEMVSKFDMVETSLPVTYRCPRAVVEKAQGVVGDGIIIAHDGAEEGVVEHRAEGQLQATLDELRDGDMVLSRANAPLMGHALRLIRQGRKAVVRGRDIGRELSNLVRRLGGHNAIDILSNLEQWREREIRKFQKQDNEAGVMRTNDKADTVLAVIEAMAGPDEDKSAAALMSTMENLFSDEVAGVVFSSIHRSKGLEADRVVILGPHLIPHPMGKSQAALQQEANLQYVAYTRAVGTLIIQDVPNKKK